MMVCMGVSEEYFKRDMMKVIKIDSSKTFNHDVSKVTFIIGRFQSMHKGHQELIKYAERVSKDTNIGVITFSPDPRDFFTGKTRRKLLTEQEKHEIFKKFGIKVVLQFTFDTAFSKLSKTEFIETLSSFNIKELVHGSDFRFGNPNCTENVIIPKGFSVFEMNDVSIDGNRLRTSELEDLLINGKIKTLNERLGYQYFIRGEVIHGKKIARTFGYPTANIKIDKEKMLPKPGVYAVKVTVTGEIYNGICHFGSSPTFSREEAVVEVHILRFDNEIYGDIIEIQFYNFIREIVKFDSRDALKLQIRKDLENFPY